MRERHTKEIPLRPTSVTDKATEFVCANCHSSFVEYRVYAESGKAKYCSHACHYAGRKRSPEDRFWEKVDKSGDCWLWTAGKSSRGYGKFFIAQNEPEISAHRFSYELAHGPIPEGMYVCHRCDNRRCVNPSHLFLGTHQQNIEDMVVKQRHAQGNRNGCAKLTVVDVVAIRQRYATGSVTQSALAAEYNVTQTAIYGVVRRITW